VIEGGTSRCVSRRMPGDAPSPDLESIEISVVRFPTFGIRKEVSRNLSSRARSRSRSRSRSPTPFDEATHCGRDVDVNVDVKSSNGHETAVFPKVSPKMESVLNSTKEHERKFDPECIS
jgi:hypothetical protein